MSNTDNIKKLYSMKQNIELAGGYTRISKQHESGKMTARERIEMIFDKGSFVEIDAFVESRCVDFNMQEKRVTGDGVVTGYGTIAGRLVCLAAQDFTVIGGSLGEMHAQKITKVMDLALKMGVPFININDSGGARIEEGIDALKGFGEIFYRNTLASGVIPQISVIMGPCAGGAVYSPAITDFVFMVDETSQMFITGPQVIKTVTGEDVSFEALGGATTHNTISGVAHFKCNDEKQCLMDVKRLLEFLPDNNLSNPPLLECNDDINRINEQLNDVIPEHPNKPYDMKDVINAIVDKGDFFEVQKEYAQNILVGFARLDGSVVGIVANQPKVLAGVLDVNSSDKAARFIRFCDAFNIPLVTLTDVPGYLPGTGQEHAGVIRHGAKLLYAYSEATVPKVNVILRKAYGGAYIAMSSRHLGADMVFAWPTAEIAVMGSEGAANIIFRRDIEQSQNPEQLRSEMIEQYKSRFANPYVAASRGYIDDVIEPATTRPRLINALKVLASKREGRPAKKHGNMPL